MVFICGSDNQLYVNRLVVNTWTGWQPLGGTLTADPVAVRTIYDGGFYSSGFEGNYQHGIQYIVLRAGTPFQVGGNCVVNQKWAFSNTNPTTGIFQLRARYTAGNSNAFVEETIVFLIFI